jgi:hypothetical protein
MRKPVMVLLLALALVAGVFGAAFLCARHWCVARMAQSTDDLDWLRMEFHLTAADLARIRHLHEGYLPICAANCERIAAKKQELAAAEAAGTNSPARLAELRAEVTALRTKCQGEMLAHFEAVSRAMPADQGARYLAEMKRLTLGDHEQVEASMAGTNGHVHDHP